MNFRRCVRALPLLAAGLVCATAAAENVVVGEPWVRATVAGQKATGAFMELRSAEDAVLVSASSPVAGVVEIHEMVMDGNVMKMRAMPRLDLPAGKSVLLRPGGYHVMLMELKQPLKKGDTVPLSLRVEGKDRSPRTVDVVAEVREITATGPKH
jgi:hypothetical protein